VLFRRSRVGRYYVDLWIVDDKIVLAPIAVQEITPAMRSRLKSMMKQLDYKLAIIANFHHARIQITIVR